MQNIRFIYIITAALVVMQSCKRDNIMTYEGGNYIQFVRGYNDSSLFSFLGMPDQNTATVPVAVQLAGRPAGRDRNYKISVVNGATTATTANYELPGSFTLRANRL